MSNDSARGGFVASAGEYGTSEIKGVIKANAINVLIAYLIVKEIKLDMA